MQPLLQKISQTWISPEQLENFKQQFQKQVDSPRLLARIHTLDDFLYALQQRDVLSEQNTEHLEKICYELRSKDLVEAVQNRKYMKRCEIIDGANIYASERIKDSVTPREPINNITHLENNSCYNEGVDLKKRNAIYKLIANDIGRKWREFGRSLGIREGDMDDLDSQFPKDFKSKVYGLFKILEEDVEGRRKYIVILGALDECRRNDLRRKTDEILNS